MDSLIDDEIVQLHMQYLNMGHIVLIMLLYFYYLVFHDCMHSAIG